MASFNTQENKKKLISFTRAKMMIFFFGILLFSNKINAQTPNAPEAASFEPVDATDMVNLLTGDLTYVLPLLNVPSPEGGYPIALSYHGGIAMDQEASWVGLGWNINPGTINRNINGTPDDLFRMDYNEFFYDAGYTDSYYNFSIGATFYNAIDVGVGLSWGSNRSMGGYVSAGISGQSATIGGSIGTGGFGIYGGYGGISGSIGSDGVGIGIGSLRMSYNSDSGLSGNLLLMGNQRIKSSLGISLNSSGLSINGKMFGQGVGNSTSTQTIDSGDYGYGIGTKGFGINTGVFNVGFQKSSVKFSLFKYDDIYTSGILYPFANILNKDSNGGLKENYFMDVNTMQRFSENDFHRDLVDESIGFDKNNLIVPSYDNYVVSAQGLSGSISPYIYNELNLSSRGREEANNDNKYVTYVNDRTNGNIDRDFTFSSDYNSFLRLSKTNIFNTAPFSTNGDNLLDAFKTNSNNIYSTIGLNANNKKREGNVIRTFTNKEIRDSYVGGVSNIPGFINAIHNTGVLNRDDNKVFLDNSIGAYQITALDGKTYHYSLPVYQFESFYKNFRNAEYNGSGEYENFLEIQKTTPYATHWLLTSITGPDYVDVNNDGKLDKDDYGYWVEFNYGKWSDGYVWKTPNGRNEEIIDKTDPAKKTYAYAWGRKQIYYLDAIKTRTHTALFVKEIREDNKSVVGNEKDISLVSNKYSNLKTYQTYYTWSGDSHVVNFSNIYSGAACCAKGKRAIFRDVSPCTNYLLKLKKIILIKNEDIATPNLNTIGSNLISNQQLSIKYASGYRNIQFTGPGGSLYSYYVHTGIDNLYDRNPAVFNNYDLHQQQNVLDIKDIEGLNLEGKSLKVIDFNQDYSLAKDSPNGAPGKLTLLSVTFKGKEGVALIPPYAFSYNQPFISFDENDIDDWGFHKDNPQIWSLNNIKIPTGGNIKIDYESDSYYTEAATYENKDFTSITISSPNSQVGITFNDGTNLNDYFKVGRDINLSFTRQKRNSLGTVIETKEFDTKLNVAFISGNVLWLNKITDITDGLPISFTAQCPSYSQGIYCYSNLKIKNNKYPLYTDANINGKRGGGIRTKAITIDNGLGDLVKTEYLYTNSLTNKISGITSYAPSKVEKGIPYVSELPSPMVTYSEVTMITKNGAGAPIDKTIFEFETLSPQIYESGYIFSLGQSFRVKENQSQSFHNNQVIANKFTIENRLGNIGRIKSVKRYNAFNQLLTKKVNTYKQNLDSDAEIGVNQETFKSYKVVKTDNISKYYVNSTSKVVYPSVLQNTTNTEGGYTNITSIDSYDFLTGQVLETTSTFSNGKSYKMKTVPAYLKYPEMGSKIDNNNNRNMLLQSAVQYSYLLDSGVWKETGVGITTWNNIWNYKDIGGNTTTPSLDKEKIWRKHESYIWNGLVDSNGIFLDYVSATDDGFIWGVGLSQTNLKWKRISEVTLYNNYSAVIEEKDINGNKVSTKMGDNDTKIIAVGNSGYNEMFYASAENIKHGYWLEPEVRLQDGSISTTYSHNGRYSVKTTSNSQFGVFMRAGEHRAGKYKLSVWIHKANVANARLRVWNNSNLLSFSNETYHAGDWVLKTAYLDVSTGDFYPYLNSVDGSEVYFDDLMIRPVASFITGYVYNKWGELEAIVGNNGLATKFEYDAAGRLISTYSELIDLTPGDGTGGFKLVKGNAYHFKNQ